MPLEDARVDLPSLISIRIWLKEEDSASKRPGAERTVFAEARRQRKFGCGWRSRATSR